MKLLKEFLKLTRFEHALMLALAVFLSEFIVLSSFPVFTTPIILSLLVPIFSEMGSFSLNDYLDIKTDKINKRKDRPLVKGTIKPEFAYYFAWAAIITSTILAYFINIYAFSIALIFNILAILYNYKLKDLPILGNVYIALSMSIPFIFGNFVISESLNSLVLLLALLAFFSGFGRELIKSVQDMEGDKKARKSKTFPLLYGERTALLFASFSYILFLIITALLFIQIRNPVSLILLFIISLFFITQILELAGKNKKSNNFLEKSRKWSLYSLFLGLVAILIEIII